MTKCKYRDGEFCTRGGQGLCGFNDDEQLDCEDYEESTEYGVGVGDYGQDEDDPCATCERDDCYQILYGRCDRKR